MNGSQSRGKNFSVFNEHEAPLYSLRKTNMRSLIGLYVSEALLYAGFILIVLNNMNIVSPGSYFGLYSWVTSVVFSIGMIINFVSIPHLYFSSFKNFSKEDDFWDKETFWILPLFFFGTFFLYGSNYPGALALLLISVSVIAVIHFKFILSAWKITLKNASQNFASHQQYFVTLKYLTAYYLILLAVLILVNPLQHAFLWIRIHMG